MSRRYVAAVALVTTLLSACTGSQATPTSGQPTSTSGQPTPTSGQPTPTSGQPTPTSGQPTATASPDGLPFVPLLEEFAAGFEALTLVTHAGDGTGLLYAVEQRGVIRVIESDGTVAAEPFLDIRDRVTAGGEQGLLGLAFHPQYAENGRLFVNYTDLGGDTVVAEFARTGAVSADGASERRLLGFEQPFANHNGGMLAFGPDGYLYISTGDGGGGGDPLDAGQDLTTLLGKVLRVDVDIGDPYAIPADNPFAAGSGGARPEIWAYGLRNPWRFSFDRQTGDMFIGDVGQGTWEEVDVQPAGESGRNYGWDIMEGPDCYQGAPCDPVQYTGPVASYSTRTEGHCAVTGGYVYRGAALPDLVGTYVFGDYCAGVIYGFHAATAIGEGEAQSRELVRARMSISAFGEDEQGEIYVVGHGGRILRLADR